MSPRAFTLESRFFAGDVDLDYVDKANLPGADGTPVDIYLDDLGTDGNDSGENWSGYVNASRTINGSSSCKWGALPGDFVQTIDKFTAIGDNLNHADIPGDTWNLMLKGELDWLSWQPKANYPGVVIPLPPIPTATLTPTPTATETPSPTPTATPTLSPTPMATPSQTPTETAVPTLSPTATVTPSSTATATPMLSPTPTANPSPTSTATVMVFHSNTRTQIGWGSGVYHQAGDA